MTNGVNPNGAGSSTQLDPHAMSLIQYQEYLERCHTAYTTAANAANELRQHPNFDRYHAYLEQESKALLQLMVGRDLVEEVTQSAGTSTTSRAAPPSLETAIEDCRKALSARVDQATRMPEPPAGIHTVPGLAPLWNVFRHFRDIKLKLVEEMETTLNAFENLVHLSPSQRVQNLQAVFHHLEFRPGHHLTHFEFLEVEYERHWPSLCYWSQRITLEASARIANVTREQSDATAASNVGRRPTVRLGRPPLGSDGNFATSARMAL